MIQNKYHGQCATCNKTVNPFEGFITRGAGKGGWIFKHQSCATNSKEVLGRATQPVREPGQRLCSLCDKWKPSDRFNGKKRCIECWARQLRISAEGSMSGGRP